MINLLPPADDWVDDVAVRRFVGRIPVGRDLTKAEKSAALRLIVHSDHWSSRQAVEALRISERTYAKTMKEEGLS